MLSYEREWKRPAYPPPWDIFFRYYTMSRIKIATTKNLDGKGIFEAILNYVGGILMKIQVTGWKQIVFEVDDNKVVINADFVFLGERNWSMDEDE